MNCVKLEMLAKDFRDAIEIMGKDDLNGSEHFKDFPSGCCGDTSELLSIYLKESEINTIYVSGEKGSQSHGWLEYKDYIIDITADQFSDVDDKVIITNNRSWHDQFEIKWKRVVEIYEIDHYNMQRLMSLYNKIIETISFINKNKKT